MRTALVRVLVILLMIYIVWSVQKAFDRGDLRKASAALYGYRVPGQDLTLAALMAKEWNVTESQVLCELQIVSRYVGPITATCQPDPQAIAARQLQTFHFNIDVLRFEPAAADETTQKLFEKKDATIVPEKTTLSSP